ncbi:hypothetical protein BDV29DRAFT_146951 [Aspergillus leporis]|uniref:Uncharacterized protein n=1 Tax=Aspergillus leporis TaxID=41062 RepID=A0A5N5WX07_9EURO|nr:hypothetical protein BDV29DRAFT_146951 [Aspergillus leporis]
MDWVFLFILYLRRYIFAVYIKGIFLSLWKGRAKRLGQQEIVYTDTRKKDNLFVS